MNDQEPKAITAHDKPRVTLSQQQFELLRFREEENERNFLSLRSIEWQMPFQIYTGCGAVGAAFFSLKDFNAFGLSIQAVACISLLVLAVVFAVSIFWQVQILRRLHFNRAMQQEYIKSLHDAVCPQLRVPSSVVVPCFQFWWAFVPMQAINLLVFGAVVAYIVNATPCAGC